MDVASQPGDKNTPGPERGDDATKIEVQTLEERITILSQAVDILGKRLTRAENLIQEHNRKYFAAIIALRGDLNKTDKQILAIRTEKDRTNNALVQMINSFITPPGTT